MAEVNLSEIKFGGAVGDRQTAKLNYPPNFPAKRYMRTITFITKFWLIMRTIS